MISGGSTDEDSNRARKAWSRVESLGIGSRSREEGPTISFGPKDLEDVATPHNDALVIHARVANHEVRRIFGDSGSSVNVIFMEVFDQMSIQGYRLEPIETALFGFVGHTVYPLGEITLPLTLGSGEVTKTVMTSFIVVKAPSSYNIILGRPATSAFKAVTSTFFPKMLQRNYQGR